MLIGLKRPIAFCLVTIGFCSFAAHASIPWPVEVVCPVGGEKFEYYETAAYTIFGSRPDGKPYGTWVFPNPLAECPTNKLIIFDKFTDEEIDKLKVIIASPEYLQLAVAHTPYYRAYWLAKALNRTREEQRSLMMQATWEADKKDTLRKEYLREFLAFSEALPDGDVAFENSWLQLRYANAERELGLFENAKTRINMLLDRRIIDNTNANGEFPQEVKFLRHYAKKLMSVIKRRDSEIEPKSLVPKKWKKWD